MEAMLKHAQDVLRMEAEAILELVPRVDANFAAAVSLILECPGRTVITGMGKSGIIGRKMAATFASTGTPSFYLHPAEGIHGDLGMVTADDVVIALSNSGETGEILNTVYGLYHYHCHFLVVILRHSFVRCHYSLGERGKGSLHYCLFIYNYLTTKSF